LTCPTRPDFDRAWDYLEPAAQHWRGHNRQTVWDAIEQRRAKLWLLDDSAAVTTIWTYPNGHKSAQAWLAGGDLAEIIRWAAGDGLQYAHRNRCNECRMVGRRGFHRLMPSGEYTELGTVVVRDL
jgi:hypothetical protein